MRTLVGLGFVGLLVAAGSALIFVLFVGLTTLGFARTPAVAVAFVVVGAACYAVEKLTSR